MRVAGDARARVVEEREKSQHAALQPAMRIDEIADRFGALVIARHLHGDEGRAVTAVGRLALAASIGEISMMHRVSVLFRQ
ncbi:hypothetical protein [Caballeronia novacaledonica]|uniref:hypothetical protein n=1 Tax=Caballeronia novacaledonica TaxID=1544861 RepID=UPI001FE2ADFF|nr:hypothetical protein [Caballeronia novacaledonica]